MSEQKKEERLSSKVAFGTPRIRKARSSGNQNTIPLPRGAKTSKKRVGQGPGSGIGKTSARGQKGQKARAASMKRGFEGGQLPLHRRLPKRGFTSKHHKYYQPVNLSALAKSGLKGVIFPEDLKKKNLIQDADHLVKILGTGEINHPIEITADGFSSSAKEKILKVGGKVLFRNKAENKIQK